MTSAASASESAPPPAPEHAPVMAEALVAGLAPADGGVYVDATFGAGGHSSAILAAADCTVFAIDRDPAARRFAETAAGRFPGRLTLLTGRFGDMAALLDEAGAAHVNGVAFDLGVSSMQLDQSERGFSFRGDGPLDMRMGAEGPTAADLVNTTDERALADLIYAYGEERASRRIARAITERRAEQPYTRTLDLAKTVRAAVKRGSGGPGGARGIDSATRTFQALRIAVNDELEEVKRGLAAAETLLAPGGRVCVLAFHSLEDRLVKRFFQSRSGSGGGPRHAPPVKSAPPSFRLIERRAQRPSAAETAVNPRARSARLRVAERTSAPAHTSAPGAPGAPGAPEAGEAA
ncbi:MAG: 16S rRNA (cytosine(1402)-N(4))-methyltransferase RsmH [Rhodospirillales bacterium]